MLVTLLRKLSLGIGRPEGQVFFAVSSWQVPPSEQVFAQAQVLVGEHFTIGPQIGLQQVLQVDAVELLLLELSTLDLVLFDLASL